VEHVAEFQKWDIYLFAGVATGPSMFIACKEELERRLQLADQEQELVIGELFPYGYHTENLISQVLHVHRDMMWRQAKSGSGVAAAADLIRKQSADRPVLLIGHSGGGIAAYRVAAELVEAQAITDCRVVQVGSPKVAIDIQLRDKVSYLVAVNEEGRPVDRISRLGTWGGWSLSRTGFPYWNKRKYAPGTVDTITLLGGHPHYFSSRAPHIHPDRGSNLSVTLDTIWRGLRGQSDQ